MFTREPQPRVLVDDENRRALIRRVVERMHPDGCPSGHPEHACFSRPSKVTALRKRAGMMRSVSSSLPRSGKRTAGNGSDGGHYACALPRA